MQTRHWELLRDHDDALYEKSEAWRQHVFTTGALPRKTKELMLMAMCATIRFLPGLRIHVERAWEAGASDDELFETCVLSQLIGGVPAYMESVLAIDEMIRERDDSDLRSGNS